MSSAQIIGSVERKFKGDTYRTPDDKKPYVREILSLGCRWSFYLDYFNVVFRLWLRAHKKQMDYNFYTRVSGEILDHVEGHRGRLDLEGLDHVLENDESCVIIGNHTSSLEAQTLAAMLNTRKIAFVMKDSLLTTPFFGPIMAMANPIPVTRTDPMKDLKSVMEIGTDYLNRGYSVIIFPQGTRSDIFDPGRFNKLGIRLALKAGVSCVPLALKTDYWGNGKLLKSFGPTRPQKTVHFCFGKPIRPKGKGREAHEQVVNHIVAKLREWGAPVADAR